MSALFDHQQETEVDNLSEVRIRRFAYYQQAIDAEYVTFKAACEAVKSSSLRMCELLRGAQQERIWAVDGYDNMTHWVESRWPEISKSQLSRAIAGGVILEEYASWVEDAVAKNGNLATLPPFENQGQLRAMHNIAPENRRPVYELAVESAGGGVPSARIISETNAALNGKHTDERISRLDTEKFPSAPIGSFNTQSKGETAVKGEYEREKGTKGPFGWIEPESVSTNHTYRKIFFTFVRPATQYAKASKIAGLSIAWNVLMAHGWKPPVMSPEEESEFADAPQYGTASAAKSAPFAGVETEQTSFEEEDDEPAPKSFIAGADLSYTERPAQNNIALDAMGKMFDDEYAQ